MLDDDTKEAIHVLSRSGFFDPDDVMEIVCDEMFEGDDVDEDEVADVIDAEFEALEKDMESWPAVTDCDRLDRAFEALNQRGVIALQNAGYTQSDGYDDFMEAYEEHPKKSSIIGYCFYQGQDLERAVLGEGLYLAFGPANPDDEARRGPEVGAIVRQELQRAGFAVEWNGTFQQRIFIPKLVWQRRPPGE